MKTTNADIQKVYDCWQSHKGECVWKPQKVHWHGHRKLDTAIRQSIKTRMIEGYTADELCGAIDNYAAVLLNKDCKWSYVWTLPFFLTRHLPDDKKILQIWRFLPGQFRLDDFLAHKARKKVVEEKKTRYENIIEATDTEKKAIRDAYEKRTGKPALGRILKRVDADVDKRSFGDKQNDALGRLKES